MVVVNPNAVRLPISTDTVSNSLSVLAVLPEIFNNIRLRTLNILVMPAIGTPSGVYKVYTPETQTTRILGE